MKKLMLAATALVVLALGALPAVASATPQVSNFTNNNRHFTVASPLTGTTSEKHATLTKGGNAEVTCKESGSNPAVTGTGEFDETGQTGWIEFEFHNCEETTFGSACTTSGQSSGTIKTTTLPFHLKTATGDHTPAVLITSNGSDGTTTGGHFATFECLGGFIEIRVDGNGIIGEITSGYGASSTFTVDFKTNPETGRQTPDEVDETPGTRYHLFSSINGGEPETATEDATGTGTFTEGEPNLTTLEE